MDEQVEQKVYTKNLVLLVEGEPKIVAVPFGERPNNYLCLPPEGLQPGDERFLSYDPVTKIVSINTATYEPVVLAESIALAKQRETESWNIASIFDRFKKGYLG